MYKIKTLSNSFVVQEYNMNSKLVRQFGLKKGAATYKVENNLLKLYYYNDWFYKQPIASMDLPVEVDGIMYSANSISQGLKNIFKSSSNGGDEAIVVDTEFNTESANPIANAPVAIAINSINNAHQEAIQTLQSNIDAEVGRATSAEASLQTAIDNEVARATSAETKNLADTTNYINSNVKTLSDTIGTGFTTYPNENITAKFELLDSNISNEVTRATSAETSLQNAITAEETRATSAETALQTDIDAEELARQTADSTLNNKITATNANINENYYNKVEVDTKIDKIVAGDTSLKNYYTKAESDSNYQPKGNYALSGTSYTKVESDERYMKKGDAPTDVYTKEQVDNKLSKKQDKGDYALKSEIPSVEGLATESYVSNKIKEVVGTAPEALDTLGEIADKLSGDDDAIAAINQVLDEKVNKDEYNINQQAINNSLTDLSNNKADKSELPTIPSIDSELSYDSTNIVSNNVISSGISSFLSSLSDRSGTFGGTNYHQLTYTDPVTNKRINLNYSLVFSTEYFKYDTMYGLMIKDGIIPNTSEFITSAYTYDKAEIDAKVESLQNQLNALQELIATLGVVDDVKVNGKSVVTDKIANIDMYTKEEIDDMIDSVSFIVEVGEGNITITSSKNQANVDDGELNLLTSKANVKNNEIFFI